MAKAHVLTRSGANSKVAFHISVPGSGNNSAGVQWRTALKNSGMANVSILVPGTGTGGTISSAEAGDLANGVSYEVVKDIDIPEGLSGVDADNFLDSHHTALTTEIQGQLQKQLMYFGYVRT